MEEEFRYYVRVYCRRCEKDFTDEVLEKVSGVLKHEGSEFNAYDLEAVAASLVGFEYSPEQKTWTDLEENMVETFGTYLVYWMLGVGMPGYICKSCTPGERRKGFKLIKR